MGQERWTLEFSANARRDLRRLDRQVAGRVVRGLEALIESPAQAPGVRKLTGSREWRLRVGDWRVLFTRDEQLRIIYVARVLPRGRAYDR